MVKLVATVANSEEMIFAQTADVVEFRVDLMEMEPEDLKNSKCGEKIVTCRRKIDGGGYSGSEEERIATLLKWVEIVKPEYVDLECDVADDVFQLFNGVKVVESYHNFWETPDYAYLKELVENSRGDVFKIATMGRSRKDVEKITRLLCNSENVVAFLMGEKFWFTRIMAALLGSPFVYCFVGRSKAPGQIELGKARKILSLFGVL